MRKGIILSVIIALIMTLTSCKEIVVSDFNQTNKESNSYEELVEFINDVQVMLDEEVGVYYRNPSEELVQYYNELNKNELTHEDVLELNLEDFEFTSTFGVFSDLRRYKNSIEMYLNDFEEEKDLVLDNTTINAFMNDNYLYMTYVYHDSLVSEATIVETLEIFYEDEVLALRSCRSFIFNGKVNEVNYVDYEKGSYLNRHTYYVYSINDDQYIVNFASMKNDLVDRTFEQTRNSMDFKNDELVPRSISYDFYDFRLGNAYRVYSDSTGDGYEAAILEDSSISFSFAKSRYKSAVEGEYGSWNYVYQYSAKDLSGWDKIVDNQLKDVDGEIIDGPMIDMPFNLIQNVLYYVSFFGDDLLTEEEFTNPSDKLSYDKFDYDRINLINNEAITKYNSTYIFNDVVTINGELQREYDEEWIFNFVPEYVKNIIVSHK